MVLSIPRNMGSTTIARLTRNYKGYSDAFRVVPIPNGASVVSHVLGLDVADAQRQAGSRRLQQRHPASRGQFPVSPRPGHNQGVLPAWTRLFQEATRDGFVSETQVRREAHAVRPRYHSDR